MKPEKTAFKEITVLLENGDEITMNQNDVQWFSFGMCVGHTTMEAFLDFLKEQRQDAIYDEHSGSDELKGDKP